MHPVYLIYAIIKTYVASQIGMETAEWPGLPHTLGIKKTRICHIDIVLIGFNEDMQCINNFPSLRTREQDLPASVFSHSKN